MAIKKKVKNSKLTLRNIGKVENQIKSAKEEFMSALDRVSMDLENKLEDISTDLTYLYEEVISQEERKVK